MRNTPIQPRADRKICTCAVPTLRSCTDDEICGAHPEARPAGLPPLTTFNSVKLHCMYTVYSGMQEWVIQIPSIPILVSVLFPSLHLKYFRIKFWLLVVLENHKATKSTCKSYLILTHDFSCMYMIVRMYMWEPYRNQSDFQKGHLPHVCFMVHIIQFQSDPQE